MVGGSRADYSLSAERGHPVVLRSTRGDETPVCTEQLCNYQHELSSLTDLDAALWGISSQSISSHEKFQRNRGLTFPLLADEQNEVFAKYGLGLGLRAAARSSSSTPPGRRLVARVAARHHLSERREDRGLCSPT